MASSKLALGGGGWSPERRCNLHWVVAPLVKGEAQVCVTELLPTLGAGFSQLCPIPIGQLRRRRGGEMEQLSRTS